MKDKNKKMEFNLVDASDLEKELVLKGTIKDKLNTLALLCAKNPSEPNYKQLLSFCENQRNDVIYMTLKLLKDLIKEAKEKKSKILESHYIKGRLIKSFEMGARNQYIKEKIIQIIGILIRADVFAEEFIDVLVGRLIEKGKPLSLIENILQSVFMSREEQIFNGMEDFYFKNDNFRCQHNLLKFLSKLDLKSSSQCINFFNFYNQALNSLEEYPQDQRDLIVDLIVNGLSVTIQDGCIVDKIDVIRKYIKSPRSIISCLNLLIKTKDVHSESYILKVSRTTLLRNTKYEPLFLNMIQQIENKDLFGKLIDNSFHYSVPAILSLMIIAKSKKIALKSMYSLVLFKKHYHPVVRHISTKFLKNEEIQQFDPFDKVYLDGFCARLVSSGY